jgi:hypothetical protein
VARLVIPPTLRDNIEYRDWTRYKSKRAYDLSVQMERDDIGMENAWLGKDGEDICTGH